LRVFEKETQELNKEQKERFAQFLTEFQDVFFKEVIAGNCNVIEYTIKIKDSNPIKQTPRRISFRLRKKVR